MHSHMVYSVSRNVNLVKVQECICIWYILFCMITGGRMGTDYAIVIEEIAYALNNYQL